jgi:hypothetical protein
VGRKFRIQRSRGQTVLLKFSKPRGEPHQGCLAKLDERLLKSCVDGVRFAQHHTGRIALTGEKFQPATKACLENFAGTQGSGVGGRGIERFEGALDSVVKVVEDGEQNALFAVEVQIEGASRNARPRDDVRDARPPVALACKDPRRGIQQLPPPSVARQKRPFIGY